MAVKKCDSCGASLSAEDGVCQFCGSKNVSDSASDSTGLYDVVLVQVGLQKINVIKVIREVLHNGLKSAKEMADNAPSVLKSNIGKKDSEELKEKFEAVGARVEIRKAGNQSLVYASPEGLVPRVAETKGKTGCLVVIVASALALFATLFIGLAI